MSLAMLLDSIFGCYHRNLSRVFTIQGRTYRVCCDCGAEFDYSLETMEVTHRQRRDFSSRGVQSISGAAA
jgi:hypothetical protein